MSKHLTALPGGSLWLAQAWTQTIVELNKYARMRMRCGPEAKHILVQTNSVECDSKPGTHLLTTICII